MNIEEKKRWTIRELMQSAIDHFRKYGFDDARLNIELLLSYALGLQRIQLYLNFDKPLTSEELKRFSNLYKRRLQHEPLQYIIGKVNFMGLNFVINTNVFIPRPETETLVEQAILFCQKYSPDKFIQILEIGTGCGNIAVSLAKFIRNSTVTSFDINSKALEIAIHNATIYGVESKINFFVADVFDDDNAILKNSYDLIISNPPYIPKDEWYQLQKEIKDYEPESALTDGDDGMKFYKRVSELVPRILKSGGGVILEVGFGQANKVATLLESAGLERIQIIADLQGIPRVVVGTRLILPENYIGLN